ncbi:MAG TPA: hypothetical protein VNX15_02600 [Gemmatimonadales bacterium]|nr:hypothetical protein [Gemmatimonadales bacterium]
MRIGRPTLFALGIAAVLAGCTEDATAPGKCPGFCPSGQLAVVDTILYIISRDSSHIGYVQADSAIDMLAINAFGVDSRPIFKLGPVPNRLAVSTTDTTTSAALSVDSALLTLNIDRRDTLATNLRISLYRLPLTIDSGTTLGDLSGPFTDSLVRTVNVDSVLALPGGVDSIAGDSVVATDTTRITLRVVMKLDSAQAAYVAADSGRSAFGIRISADSLASVAFRTLAGGAGPILTWWATFDSSGTNVHRVIGTAVNLFNSFVHNVPMPALDSNLLVGGVPSARSLLRFSLPRNIRDSTQVVRATLLMVPITAPVGVPSDSVILTFARVSADLGAKSPCIPVGSLCSAPGAGDSSVVVAEPVRMNATDTIATDVTLIVRAWQGDTLGPQALMVRQLPEGANLISLRLYSSRSTAFRPALHITYVPRYSFGSP